MILKQKKPKKITFSTFLGYVNSQIGLETFTMQQGLIRREEIIQSLGLFGEWGYIPGENRFKVWGLLTGQGFVLGKN